ncbi:MAG: SDR family oxidoreductase [Armatimonadota bacterium]|jgi:UDP-glucose 4-epimerase
MQHTGAANSATALVTGGAGFIGANIVKRLVADGHHVTVLDNLVSGHRENLDGLSGVTFIEGDVRDAETVREAMDGVDVIFHLAASVGNRRSIEDPVTDSEVNVIGTIRVLEAAREAGTRKIVVSSSAGILGELKTLPIREDHPLEPVTPYGASKLCEEKMCLAYARLYDVEAIALRYFNVYGPLQRYDAYGNVIPIFAFRMLRGEPLTIFGDGEQTRDFVNVRDVVEANIRAADAVGVSGAFNIASATRISINRLVELMREGSGLDPEVRSGPPRRGDVRDSLADISAAQAQLGYQPATTMRDGLAEYFDWAREDPVVFTEVAG